MADAVGVGVQQDGLVSHRLEEVLLALNEARCVHGDVAFPTKSTNLDGSRPGEAWSRHVDTMDIHPARHRTYDVR